jgi:hypothetical protein
LNPIPPPQNLTISQPKDPAQITNPISLKSIPIKTNSRAAPYPVSKTKPTGPSPDKAPARLPESPRTHNEEGLFDTQQYIYHQDEEMYAEEEPQSLAGPPTTLSHQQSLENLADSLNNALLEAKNIIGKNSRSVPGFDKAETALSNLVKLFNDESHGLLQNQISQLTAQMSLLHEKINFMNSNVTDTLQAQNQKLGQIQSATAENQHEIKTLRTTITSLSHNPPPKTAATYATAAKPPPLPKSPDNTPQPKLPTFQTNPKAAHHPSRLAIQFLPDGIPENKRKDPMTIVETVNQALGNHPDAKHLKVVAAKFNNQGNLILSTRADQKAAELISFSKIFIDLINCGYSSICREDKRWFKIQIDGVSTTCTTMNNERRARTGAEVHAELISCNLVYQQATKHLTTPPRWMRTLEETQNIPLSSVVFAIDNEEHAKLILGARTLAAFGRHCTMRAYQDHPPVPQCKGCWSLDHKQDKCTYPPTCRLCGRYHLEADHPTHPCQSCSPVNADGMNMSHIPPCTHHLACSNCEKAGLATDVQHPADSRRCPARLQKYGSVRIVERKAMKSPNPWKSIPQKTRKTTKPTTKTNEIALRPNPIESPTPTPFPSLQSSIHNPSPTHVQTPSSCL